MPSRNHGESAEPPLGEGSDAPRSLSPSGYRNTQQQDPTIEGASRADAGFDFQPPQSQLMRSAPSKTLVPTMPSGGHSLHPLDPQRQQAQQQQHRPSSSRRAEWAAQLAQQHYQAGAIMYPRTQQQTGRAQNSMDLPRRHQRDPYAPVDLDNAVADVFNAPLGSFTEDSPPRGGCSSSDDERMKRHAQRSPRNSPQGSPLGGRHTMPPQQSYPPPYDRGGYHSYQRKPPYPGAPPAGAPSSHRGVPPPPPYHASGRDSYPPQPPPGYPPQQAYYGYPPQQQHQQPEHNWNSPPALDDSFPPHPVTDSNNKLMMRGSPLRGSPLRGPPMRSSPLRASPAREPRGFSSISTPDKRPGKIFRSPPSTRASPPSNRKSPMFHASPSIGGYGSFGMIDTPGGTLAADFSPMGPSFAGLGDETPAPPSNDAFGGRQLNLSRSTSSGEFGAPMIQQRPTKADQSPFGAFINDFSPAFASNNSLPNVPRSPVRSASQARRAQGGPPHFSHSQEHPPSAILEEVRSIAPVAAPAASEAKPRQLWQESGAGAGAMRLELGTRTHSTQRHLEGINSMMRAQQQQGGIPQHYSTPSSHHAYGGLQHPGAPRGPPISHHVQSSFPHPMNTPMKGPPRQQQMRMAQPPAHYAPSASMTKQAPPPSQHQSQQQQHQAQQQHQRNFAPVAITAPQVKQGSSGGKENTAGAKGRRGPCNCKKSKCLKLYCECFSQERFCDGCNCVECNNIPSFANVRDKAIKETRAKNAEAFKPRITGGHNMGCKCKKSECLKKYCECFQAGFLCSSKCKCSSCMNHAGSQKLIDKRRKMKDTIGAEYAMRVAEESWKGVPRPRNPQGLPHHRVPLPSPAGGRPPMIGMHAMMGPSPHGHQGPSSSNRAPPHFMGAPYMGPPHMGSIGYSPMGVPPITPGYGDPRMGDASRFVRDGVMTAPGSGPRQTLKRPAQEITPGVSTPKTPGARLAFDPSLSRKKRKKENTEEEMLAYFGPSLPLQTKTAALAIFSFLSNCDVYKAAQVCKEWKRLATDDELWQID